ncbi:hypothetical protein Bbelb_094610 [Branchiostoma belcheri]|nr:hypothetical protein Bbelb_094610 [Branchiostoma belcheri]
MAEHMEMHKTRRPGRGRQRSRSFCLLCEYSAADRLQLEYHMFSHAEKLGDLLLCRDGEVAHDSSTAERLVSGQTSEGLATDVNVNSGNRTVQKAYPRGTLWCGECGYTTRLKTDLSKHLKTHQKKFVCDVCGFQSWNELALQAHKGDRMLECDKCGYSVSCKAEMRKHAKTHHAEKTVHRCEKCSFKTTWKSVLDSHVKIHTDEKPFTCGQCDYKSAFKESLTGTYMYIKKPNII